MLRIAVLFGPLPAFAKRLEINPDIAVAGENVPFTIAHADGVHPVFQNVLVATFGSFPVAPCHFPAP